MGTTGSWVRDELERRGVTRRVFLGFCGTMASVLALPRSVAGEIALALENIAKPTLVWLEFQDCAGDTESLLRTWRPTVAEIVLDTLSIDYHETIMAAAGHQAEELLARVVAEQEGRYLAVVEGSIPVKDGGVYCMIGGRTALDIAQQVCGGAAVTIAAGTCAAFGGLPAASPDPTGALSVDEAVPGIKRLVNLPACPLNAENLAALVVYYVTYSRLPELDALHRPLFAHGKTIHEGCDRRAQFENGRFVERWGDEAHRCGSCLYKMGCKGPVTYHNCPNVRWNGGTSWSVASGHPCIGCAEPGFWDRMTPFYDHLPGVPGLPLHTSLDKAGILAAGTLGGVLSVHRGAQLGRERLAARGEEKPGAPAPEGGQP